MKQAILLSIHPKYVKKIISREKSFMLKIKTKKYQPNKFFIDYYKNKDKAIAYKLDNVRNLIDQKNERFRTKSSATIFHVFG